MYINCWEYCWPLFGTRLEFYLAVKVDTWFSRAFSDLKDQLVGRYLYYVKCEELQYLLNSYIHHKYMRNIIKHNDELQWTNEHTSLQKYNLSLFILERVMVVVCERWAGDRDRLLYLPQVLLTITAFLSHLGLELLNRGSLRAASPQSASWFSHWHSISNWLEPSVPYCLMSTYFRCSSAYLHRFISWLTARLKVNI